MTMKKFMWILLIGLGIGIPVLISDLYWMWIPFLAHSQEYPAKVSASLLAVSIFVTLLLALTAVRAIEESDKREVQHRQDGLNREKRDKKERLLNEIIEWAINVANCNIGVNSLDSLKAEEDPTGKADQILTHAQLSEWGIRLQSIMKRGKYIISPSAEIFCDDLKTAIKTLNDDSDKFVQSLSVCADITYKGLSSTIYREEYDKSIKLNLILEKSAQKVIEEAIKIKARDIS